jgi:pantoate--beta-alanine ligase
MGMQTIQSPVSMHDQAIVWKRQGLKIALVPTMGCLHAGHLSLMREAARHADKVIVSLFVNPIQFGPNEDFNTYPRQFETDCQLAEQEGVDVVFHPNAEEMYPAGFQTSISVRLLSQGLCGAGRPGHFDGVATVVSKLFNCTIPDAAVFGEKDFQQLAIIRQMVRDLNFFVKVIGCPIVREEDGLAMSSRNKYLRGEMRTQALCLYKSIAAGKDMVAQAQTIVPAQAIVDQTKKIVAESGGELEYAVVVDEQTLQQEQVVGKNSVLALAVKIGGSVRLIDNAKLFPPTEE